MIKANKFNIADKVMFMGDIAIIEDYGLKLKNGSVIKLKTTEALKILLLMYKRDDIDLC